MPIGNIIFSETRKLCERLNNTEVFRSTFFPIAFRYAVVS